MSFPARGYGGSYHDVVASPRDGSSPLGGVAEEEEWSPGGVLAPGEQQHAHASGEYAHDGQEEPHAYSEEDGDYERTPSSSLDKQQQQYQQQYHDGGVSATSPRGSHVSTSTLEQASSILSRMPGAKTVSYANAGLVGGCGVIAGLVAWLAGLCLLLVLLGRWYLPAHETHHNLPLHFDYAAARSQAAVWVALIKPSSPAADALVPPAKPYTAASAGLRGLLTPHTSSSGSAAGRSTTKSGLGFSPFSRHSGSSSSSSGSTTDAKDSWWWARITGSARRRRRAAARAAAAAGASVMHDAGYGVSVPEGDWLVPLRGDTRLAVELRMPGWPPADMVQLTGELFSPHGISLGRWTATWVPKPKPLIFRLISSAVLGPWRALGLVDDTVRVELPLFESFQNPVAPPEGWGSVPGYSRFVRRQQQVMESLDEFGGADEDPGGGASATAATAAAGAKGGASEQQQQQAEAAAVQPPVPGPRALWLRVTLSGRSYEAGPPSVYSATAKLDVDRGLIDRLLASLRPSFMTALLVLTVGGALMCGGAGTAAVLLYVAYLLYCWGSRAGNAAADEAAADAEAARRNRAAAADHDLPWSLKDFVVQDEGQQHGVGVGGSGGSGGELSPVSLAAYDDGADGGYYGQEQEGEQEDDGYGTPLNMEGWGADQGGFDDDYSAHHAISEEGSSVAAADDAADVSDADADEGRAAAAAAAAAAQEEQEPHSGGAGAAAAAAAAAASGASSSAPSSEGGDDERYVDPSFPTAADELYSSPRSSQRSSLEGGRAPSPLGHAFAAAAAAPASHFDAERLGAARRSGSLASANSIDSGGGGGRSNSRSVAAAAGAAAPAPASNRLWSVFGARQKQQQQQQSGYGGVEDLPPSLNNNSGSTPAAAAAAAAAAVADDADADADDVYEEASGEIPEAGQGQPEQAGDAEGSESSSDWKRKLLGSESEEDDDGGDGSGRQQQQVEAKGAAPLQQQQQHEAESSSVLLRDSATAPAPVKRRFGFRFGS